MVRIIFGVIVGFIAWSILWVGGEEAIAALSPGWYGAHKLAFEKAAMNGTAFNADPMILLVYILRSVITSLMSGYLAVVISKEAGKTTVILGILLLAVGIFVESMAWSLLPVWYHIVFLILLIPVTIAGGRLAKRN